MDRPEGLPVGTDHSGEDQMLCSHADTATDGADTTGSGWAVNWTDGTSEASGTASTDQADMVQVVFMATHTTEGDIGSQYTQPTGLLQPPVQQPVTRNCCTGESSGRATETLPVQPMVSAHDRNMVVTPVSIQMMAGLHNPSNMAVPSAGMDVQDGSSDLAAQMGTSMQQQAQDVYWIHHSSLFHLIGKCFPASNLCSSLQLWLLHRSQQAQDAVTMSPMWRMMSTDLQQQQHMVYPIYGPGMPRTPLHQNAGTPVGKLWCLGGMATPRFPAPTQIHATLPGASIVAASTAFPAERTTDQTMTSVLPQKQLSSQNSQDSDSPASDSQLTAFTLDPPAIHQLPPDINETMDMGQHGGEELVPEGEYDVFRQTVQSSLGQFHSSGDNVDDFLIGSLIPTDEVLKDKIMWVMQSSLKASLTYSDKIAQGVFTADKVIDTTECAPPTVQKNKFKFFTSSNVLGKGDYRLMVVKSSEYQPTPPELASSKGSKAKVSQYTVSAQHLLQTEELMGRVAIYGSITDLLVAPILKYIPEEAKDKVVQKKVMIMHKSLHKAIASAMAAASNLQLIRKDVALGQLDLQNEHIARTRTAPFHGHSLVSPKPEKFDEKIFNMRDQQALHRGLTSHFKISEKPAPKSSMQSRPSVHQRLGPPVGHEGSN